MSNPPVITDCNDALAWLRNGEWKNPDGEGWPRKQPSTNKAKEAAYEGNGKSSKQADLTPWDDYNQRTSWDSLLTPAPLSWTKVRSTDAEVDWLRPGSDKDKSATVYHDSDTLTVFTSSAPPFEKDKTYTKAQVFCALKYGAVNKQTLSKSGKDLRKLGYGSGSKQAKGKNRKDSNTEQENFLIPPDIQAPYGWLLEDDGLFLITGKDKETGELKLKQITAKPVWLAARNRDAANIKWGVLINWVDRDGTEHACAVGDRRFLEPNNALLQDLKEKGLSVIHGQGSKLLEYFDKFETEERYRVATTLGWCGSPQLIFVTPNAVITPPPEDKTNDQP